MGSKLVAYPLQAVARGLTENLRKQKDDHTDRPIRPSLTTISNATKGLRRNELSVLIGREGHGKSILAAQLAFDVAGQFSGQTDDQVLYVTMEMDREDILSRYYVSLSGLDPEKLSDPDLMTDNDWEQMEEILSAAGCAPVTFLDDGEITTLDIDEHIERLSEAGPVRFVVIDYLQLLADCGDDAASIEATSKRLKRIARKHRTHILALSSLNRALADYDLPSSSNIRGSGGVQYNADNVWAIHQPFKVNATLWGAEFEDVAYFRVLKQRRGATGDHYLEWESERLQFKELSRARRDAIRGKGPNSPSQSSARVYL
jgi:replicative DNA helicase